MVARGEESGGMGKKKKKVKRNIVKNIVISLYGGMITRPSEVITRQGI